MKTFGEKIKELRQEKGLTQKETAKALAVTVPTLSHWECNYQEPSFRDLAMICQFYDVSSDYLIGLDEEAYTKINAPKYSIGTFNNNGGTVDLK